MRMKAHIREHKKDIRREFLETEKGIFVEKRECAQGFLQGEFYTDFTQFDVKNRPKRAKKAKIRNNFGFEDAEEELKRMEEFRKAQAEVEKKNEKPMTKRMFKAI